MSPVTLDLQHYDRLNHPMGHICPRQHNTGTIGPFIDPHKKGVLVRNKDQTALIIHIHLFSHPRRLDGCLLS